MVARSSYRDLGLYDPPRPPCDVDLSDNTNRFGTPPSAQQALLESHGDAVSRYPSAYARSLKQAIADYVGVPIECVTTGCGSDDLLDSAIRAFAEPGERVAFPDPTFAMLPVFARMNELEPVAVPLRPDGDIDPEALASAGARVTYVCSPNNPTGARASSPALQRLIDAAPGVLILDEAYVEFAAAGPAHPGPAGSARTAGSPGGSEWTALAPTLPHVLVIRTLSKAFGLAGLRVGYAVGSAELVADVEKSRGPYKVGSLAERAAVAALTRDREWVLAQIARVVENRERFSSAVQALGLAPLRSEANFVLVPVRDAAQAAARMRERGVAVRPFVGLAGIGDAIRITMAPWAMLERALASLQEALA